MKSPTLGRPASIKKISDVPDGAASMTEGRERQSNASEQPASRKRVSADSKFADRSPDRHSTASEQPASHKKVSASPKHRNQKATTLVSVNNERTTSTSYMHRQRATH